MTIIHCKVHQVEKITNTIYRVKFLPKRHFSFRAGQYLFLIIDKNKHAFSLASTPIEKEFIELHIGGSTNNSNYQSIIDYINNSHNILIDIPYGHAWLREVSNRPIILVAGGTGFSYARSILLTILTKKPTWNVTLYWGGKRLIDLYELEKLTSLTMRYPNLKIIPVIQKSDNSEYRIGKVIDIIMQDFQSLSNYDIYIAGRFEIAKMARDIFCKERGAIYTKIYGDAFSCL